MFYPQCNNANEQRVSSSVNGCGSFLYSNLLPVVYHSCEITNAIPGVTGRSTIQSELMLAGENNVAAPGTATGYSNSYQTFLGAYQNSIWHPCSKVINGNVSIPMQQYAIYPSNYVPTQIIPQEQVGSLGYEPNPFWWQLHGVCPVPVDQPACPMVQSSYPECNTLLDSETTMAVDIDMDDDGVNNSRCSTCTPTETVVSATNSSCVSTIKSEVLSEIESSEESSNMRITHSGDTRDFSPSVSQQDHLPISDIASGSSNVQDEMMGSVSQFIGGNDCVEYGGRSYLRVFWEGKKSDLRERLTNIAYNLERSNVEIRLTEKDEDFDIFDTAESTVYNVVFNKHSVAKAAFVLQQSLKIRMHIPENNSRDWLRASPDFLVQFETKRRLSVRSGKATCRNDKLGDLLMSDFKGKKGCLIWGDQMKGHRLRIVCYKGYLLSSKFDGITLADEDMKQIIGWVTYRDCSTKAMWIERKSHARESEYIYQEKHF